MCSVLSLLLLSATTSPFTTTSSTSVTMAMAFEVETYTFQNFPKDKIALHMPCEESNMFATKCMCHLRCTDDTCLNAQELCVKYKDR